MLKYNKAQWRASVLNGRINLNLLHEVFPTQFDPDLNGPAVLHPEAAAAMSTLLQQAHEDGVSQLRVKYSYRTLAKQEEKWDNFQSGGNLAARPGTSNHGWAVAVDFTGLDFEALSWLRSNAKKYGFVNDVPSEVWHYTFQEGMWNGDDMTEGQLATLKEAAATQKGVEDFLAGKVPNNLPDGAHPARVRTLKALIKAASLPKVSAATAGMHGDAAHSEKYAKHPHVHGEDVGVA